MKIGFSELSDVYFSVSNLFPVKQCENAKTRFVMQNPRETDALLLFSEGDCICYQENEPPLYIPEGAVVYMPENSRYTWEYLPSAKSGRMEKFLFEFTLYASHVERSDDIKKSFSLKALTDNRIFFGDKVFMVTTRFSDVYRRMFSELTSAFCEKNTSVTKVYGKAYEIFGFLADDCRSARLNKNTDVIKEGIKYINQTPCVNKSVKEIADMCGVSVGYFERVFKSYYGVSPAEYISSRKILFVKQLLQNRNLTLDSIAEQANYCDSGYLCRVFKKTTGMTTNEYRAIYYAQKQTADDITYF